MAKIAICDQCGRTTPLHLGSLTPGGWLEVQEHSTGPNPPAFLVCSFGCLGAYGSAENARRAAAAALRDARRPAVRLPDHDEDDRPGGDVWPAGAVAADFGRAQQAEAQAEGAHVRAAQADSSDEGGGYVGPGE